MGFQSIHVERAVTYTRRLGALCLLFGLGVIVWALLMFPWKEAAGSPSDWQHAAISPTSNGDYAPQRMINSHESRSGESEMAASLLLLILPGVMLLVFARSMSRLNFWAYLATGVLCMGFVGMYFVDLLDAIGYAVPFQLEPFAIETILRPLGLVLFVLCLNALPDARDEFRKRRSLLRRPNSIQPEKSRPLPKRIPPRPSAITSIVRGS